MLKSKKSGDWRSLIHSLERRYVCAKFHDNLFNSCWGIFTLEQKWQANLHSLPLRQRMNEWIMVYLTQSVLHIAFSIYSMPPRMSLTTSTVHQVCKLLLLWRLFFPFQPENARRVSLISLVIAMARKPAPSHQSTSIRWRFDWISSFPSVWEALEVDKPDICAMDLVKWLKKSYIKEEHEIKSHFLCLQSSLNINW